MWQEAVDSTELSQPNNIWKRTLSSKIPNNHCKYRCALNRQNTAGPLMLEGMELLQYSLECLGPSMVQPSVPGSRLAPNQSHNFDMGSLAEVVGYPARTLDRG
jgi:hypothetical protein